MSIIWHKKVYRPLVSTLNIFYMIFTCLLKIDNCLNTSCITSDVKWCLVGTLISNIVYRFSTKIHITEIEFNVRVNNIMCKYNSTFESKLQLMHFCLLKIVFEKKRPCIVRKENIIGRVIYYKVPTYTIIYCNIPEKKLFSINFRSTGMYKFSKWNF